MKISEICKMPHKAIKKTTVPECQHYIILQQKLVNDLANMHGIRYNFSVIFAPTF